MIAYEYVKDIAVDIWERFYKDKAPEWEPCEDTAAVLTQIDNMLTGLVRNPED